ncbi:MAG: hypothetical protein WBZ39_03355 [Methylovirgula sp.]
MKRVGTARTIADIEFVIDAPSIGDPRHCWQAYGVECRRDRHRFSGPTYSFTIDVVDLQLAKASGSWHAIIVSESWHAGTGDANIRSIKWLKVLSGKASDLTAWMRRSRSMKVDAAAPRRAAP